MQDVLQGTASAVQHIFGTTARSLLDDTPEMVTKHTVNNIEVFGWMTIVGAILAFIMAFGIGANDVANTFGTSVGSKSLKIWQAAILASFTEFLGCVLMGKNVTDTVRKGIVDPAAFEDNPQVLMLGMFCALAGAGAWLLIATYLAMPVSTTHSIIGGILGFGLCYGDAMATINVETIALVIVSWVASPILSGIVAAFFFVIVRWAVLRRENSLQAAYRFYPVFLFTMFLIMSLFVIIKGSPRYQLNKLDIGTAIGISVGVATGLTLLTYFLLFRLCVQPRIEAYDEAEAAAQFQVNYKHEATAKPISPQDLDTPRKATEVAISVPLPVTPPAHQEGAHAFKAHQEGAHAFKTSPNFKAHSNSPADLDSLKGGSKGQTMLAVVALDGGEEEPVEEPKRGCLKSLWHNYLNPAEMDKKVHADIGGKSAEVNQLAEVFDPKTELLFNGVQVATAAFDSFAHGANDTANAIGPLAAIIGVASCGCIEKKTETELWIIFLGAVGLCIGLFLLGWRVIRSVGLKLVRVTPSRGFTMELSSALTVIVASKMGIPVSTTHCQIGAELGVGLLESGCGGGNATKGVNWKLFGKVFLSWIFTLVFSGLVTALLFSFALYSPAAFGNSAMDITSKMVPVEN